VIEILRPGRLYSSISPAACCRKAVDWRRSIAAKNEPFFQRI
jgi:hypothetical protein